MGSLAGDADRLEMAVLGLIADGISTTPSRRTIFRKAAINGERAAVGGGNLASVAETSPCV
jgi:hypothetical protein